MSKLSGRAQWNTANAKLANAPFANLFDDPNLVCVRCGREYIEANKVHTRLYGVTCVCGSQEWKAVEHTLAADICPLCEGSGKDPNDPDPSSCPKCKGSGQAAKA